MGTIADAAMLPALQPSSGPDVENANAVADEGIQTVTDAAVQKKQAEVQQAPFSSITHKFNPKTGKYDVSVDMAGDTFDYLGSLLQTGQATISAFEQARAQVAAKRQFQEQNPILSAVGKIASTSAAQYAGGGRGRDLSPIIRAAGAYGLEQFGQTNAELSQQEAQLQGQAFGASRALYGEKQQDEALANAEARTRVLDKRDQDRFLTQFTGQLRGEARQGLYGEGDVPALVEQLVQAGAAESPEQAKVIAEGLVKSSESKRQLDALEHQRTLSADEAKERARLQREILTQEAINSRFLSAQARLAKAGADKSQYLDVAAQAIASGDLTAIKEISSLRGGERLELFAKIKQLNPKFTTGELNRKIKMVDNFTNGKDGQQLQSLGTFLEHAGEVTDALAPLGQKSRPFLNRPINKLKKEVEGDPELQRFIVSLEPVRKEFESFLLGGRALYADDRKKAEIILSDNSSPAQIKAALQQMGKTAKDRYNEMNHRYQKVVGAPIEDPFSPEALAGAAKIGLELAPVAPAGGPSFDDYQNWLKNQK